ncbi:hypothetical protein RJ639_003009 [Escallonia herrerae]|uniref:Uncharacterized protein n=1 Tax=Escallonia herrerae TaxID=1293975 RepID=A0AA88W371_9ASTE|nr:hypothetical protein RJ639_003009 [Escallonia herrerae]
MAKDCFDGKSRLSITMWCLMGTARSPGRILSRLGLTNQPAKRVDALVNSNGEPRREFDSLSLRLYSSRNGANGLLTKSLSGYNGSTSGNKSTPNLQTRRTKTMAHNSFGHRNETAEILQNIISG